MGWLRRGLSLLDFALCSLRRRGLKNLALLSVYTLLVATLASVVFFTRAMQREAKLLLEEAPEIVVQRLSAGGHHLIPVGYAEAIRRSRDYRRSKNGCGVTTTIPEAAPTSPSWFPRHRAPCRNPAGPSWEAACFATRSSGHIKLFSIGVAG